jgi:hypothetical protein
VINKNLLPKTLLAILALIIGSSLGLYMQHQNMHPVIADINQTQQFQTIDQGNTVLNTSAGTNSTDQTNEQPNSGVDETSDTGSEPIIGLNVEVYRSNSDEGPWVEADTPAGSMLIKGDWVYWKVFVENTGEVELMLEYVTLIDGVKTNIEGFTLPSELGVGQNVEFIYKSHVFSGVHWNEVQVTGSYNPTITVSDRAYYQGVDPIHSLNNSDEQIPSFVVPEYPMGALGGLLVLLATYILAYIRK